MIRNLQQEDITKVMTIWTKGNFTAHDFIEKDYWLENFNKVKNFYLPNSDTYVYVENEEIEGFISIAEKNHIGALFVKQQYQRKGIGRKLINYCKEKYNSLDLNVYDKNGNAIAFYMAMGFKNVGVQIDENTGEKEYIMEWKVEDLK